MVGISSYRVQKKVENGPEYGPKHSVNPTVERGREYIRENDMRMMMMVSEREEMPSSSATYAIYIVLNDSNHVMGLQEIHGNEAAYPI